MNTGLMARVECGIVFGGSNMLPEASLIPIINIDVGIHRRYVAILVPHTVKNAEQGTVPEISHAVPQILGQLWGREL